MDPRTDTNRHEEEVPERTTSVNPHLHVNAAERTRRVRRPASAPRPQALSNGFVRHRAHGLFRAPKRAIWLRSFSRLNGFVRRSASAARPWHSGFVPRPLPRLPIPPPPTADCPAIWRRSAPVPPPGIPGEG